MFSAIWSFVKRHRKKIVFTGALVSGIYCLSKYVKENLLEKDVKKFINEFIKTQQFEIVQRNSDAIVIGTLSNLRDKVPKLLNTETLKKKLKTAKQENKLELWQQLKILCFTRFIASVYAFNLIVLSIKTRLNIIGAFMLIDIQNNVSNNNYNINYAANNNSSLRNNRETNLMIGGVNNSNKITLEVYNRFLDGFQFFLATGFAELVKDIEISVKDILSEVSLKELMTSESVNELLSKIRRNFETSLSVNDRDGLELNFSKYLVSSVVVVNRDSIIINNNYSKARAEIINRQIDTVDKLNQLTENVFKSQDFTSMLSNCMDKTNKKLNKLFSERLASSSPHPSTSESPYKNSAPLFDSGSRNSNQLRMDKGNNLMIINEEEKLSSPTNTVDALKINENRGKLSSPIETTSIDSSSITFFPPIIEKSPKDFKQFESKGQTLSNSSSFSAEYCGLPMAKVIPLLDALTNDDLLEDVQSALKNLLDAKDLNVYSELIFGEYSNPEGKNSLNYYNI